jgi:serine/threonine protein kinase
MNAISHRDIKPANIMKLSENKYALADYGEGKNQSYEKSFSENCFY